ncbi:MAG: hypothetical protein ACJA2E_000310, partial [Arenicella sp.]
MDLTLNNFFYRHWLKYFYISLILLVTSLPSVALAQTDVLIEFTGNSVSSSSKTIGRKTALSEKPSIPAPLEVKQKAVERFKSSFSPKAVRLKKQALKNLGKSKKLRVQTPDGRLVEGTVTGRWRFQLDGKPIDNTQITLPKGDGFLHISSQQGTKTELLYLQVINKKVFKADIDQQGNGTLDEVDPNLYFCVNHPSVETGLNADTAPYSPQLAALIPPISDLKNLQSKPGANKTLYVNYWGGTLVGSIWNADFDGIYQPFDTNGNSSSFTEAERYLMWLGWREASEDFASFDINITTSQSVYDSTPTVNRSQIIASPTNFYNAGGVAFLDVFSNTSELYKTGWASNNSAGTLGMTISHEAGHQLGLSHNGNLIREYYSGHENWGPIMGAPFGKPYVQWDRGEYDYADNTEDDLNIINGHLPYQADDAADSIDSPTPLDVPVSNFVGNIELTHLDQDQDYFSFQLSDPVDISIEIIPLLGGDGESRAANLALNATLINTQGDGDSSNDIIIKQISSADISPLSPLTNTLNLVQTLAAGSYVIAIVPEPADTNLSTGFGTYGNGGQYLMSITSNDFGTADLSVDSFSLSAASVTPLDSLTLSATLSNIGESKSGATRISYLLSDDNEISDSDIALATSSLNSLANGATTNVDVVLDVDIALGNYWIGICVTLAANELVTSNNCSTAVALTVVSPYPNNYVLNQSHPYSWLDISDQSDAGLSNVDDAGAQIPIGFSFEFYGQSYSSLWAHSNGGIKFDGDIELAFFEYINGGEETNPNNFIMPYWDDLNPAASGSDAVYFETQGSAPNRRFIIQWNALKHYRETVAAGPKETITFQTILYETSNDIVVQYQDLTFGAETDGLQYDYGANAFVGIESIGGYEGIEFLNAGENANTISDLQAISFYDSTSTLRTLTVDNVNALVGDNFGSVVDDQSQINCGPQCYGQYPQSSSINLTAQPFAGYQIRSWSVPACGSSPICTINLTNHLNVSIEFEEIDTDSDGVSDSNDNCIYIANLDQTNTDNDAQGDACDTDDDNDTVLDGSDNCPLLTNQDQLNTDNDSQGDACDVDDDNDTIVDVADNCPFVSNTAQTNSDDDDFGDACDTDDDNDNVNDDIDNCPFISNLSQINTDSDAFGDDCDADDDNDTILDGADNCPLISNQDQLNSDDDAFGDLCDTDNDNDTILDGADNCPLVQNQDQRNSDDDAFGDACDTDDDNDAVLDGVDNCPLVQNQDQHNSDGDAIGDACDSDDDNDTVLDGADNCPLISNQDQLNSDDDAIGDACDADDDNDTVLDGADNCPLISNQDQRNSDDD